MPQSIKNPIGLNVFGSALIRVAPDAASMNLSVTATQKKPKNVFEEVRKNARSVREYLAAANVTDVQSSRIMLSEEWDYSSGRRQRQGYTARVTFNVVLDDLDRIEEVICGAVDVGANEIGDVDFQSRQLKQYRAKARQQAVFAAREKANVYVEAAGVSLGRLLHIEDMNPDQLRGSEGHVVREPEFDVEGPVSAFDPGAITVGAAVVMTFSLDISDSAQKTSSSDAY